MHRRMQRPSQLPSFNDKKKIRGTNSAQKHILAYHKLSLPTPFLYTQKFMYEGNFDAYVCQCTGDT